MYYPDPVPENPEAIPSYLHRELLRMAEYLNNLEPEQLRLFVQQNSLPKPRQGDVAYSAAGNLGASEGLYRHNGSSWVYIG